MARTKRARRNSRPSARWLPWSDACATAFRLAADDWTPPKQVRLSGGLWRQTLSARFTDPDGKVMTAKIRLARDPASGERYVTGEELTMSLGVIRSGAEA